MGAGTTSSLLADTLGSVMALADSAGAVQIEYVYDPFGKTTATGALNTNPFQYTSRENDGIGLYYYRARYLDNEFQRFISEDPIGILPRGPGQLNHLYAYVDNRPTLYRDPSGLLSECEDRLLLQRMAALAACLARALYNNRAAFNLCFGICYTAIYVLAGLNPILDAGCAACVGIGLAVLIDKYQSCIDEANAIPDTCPKCKPPGR
jgi:RHS repeat-associated protein